MDDEGAWCTDCGTAREVNWCPAFAAFLCPEHLSQRTSQLLDLLPVTALPVRSAEVST